MLTLHMEFSYLTANLEEVIEIFEPIVHGSNESSVGLELVGTMDGREVFGASEHVGERA